MHLLLDTQIMLWWLVDDPRLRADTRDLLSKTACVVSVASIWEVAIKHRLGKLPVSAEHFREQSLGAGASILPILEGHVIETGQLPQVHGDPFDRLLIAQAVEENLTLVSVDPLMRNYPVAVLG